MYSKIYLVLVSKGNKFSHSLKSSAVIIKSHIIRWLRDSLRQVAWTSHTVSEAGVKKCPLPVWIETYFCPSVWHFVLSLGTPLTFCRQILLFKWADCCPRAWNQATASFPGCSSISIPCFSKNFGIPPQESYHGNEKCNWLVISFHCSMGHLTRMFWEADQRGVRDFISSRSLWRDILAPLGVTVESETPREDVLPGHVYSGRNQLLLTTYINRPSS